MEVTAKELVARALRDLRALIEIENAETLDAEDLERLCDGDPGPGVSATDDDLLPPRG